MRRSLKVAFCLAVVAIACGMAPSDTPLTAPHAPALSLSPLGTITVQSKPNLCVTVNGAFANGTPVRIQNCNGSATQKWAASSAAEYRANGLAYCLDTFNASSVEGTIAFIWDCYGPPSQQWTHTALGQLGRADGKCLEPLGQKLKTNTALVIYTCANRASQKWNAPLAPVDPPPTCQDTTATNYGGPLPCTYPPPPPTDTNTYVEVLPTQSIQAAVDANPAGTKFLLRAGTFVRQTVVPKGDNLFRLEPGAVMDGENVTAFAFKGHNGSAWVNGVKIVGGAITRYVPPAQNGAIWGGDDSTQSTTGWVLDSLDVHHNANIGIRIGNRMQVLRSQSRYNGTAGIGGIGRAVLVDGSSFTFNNNGCPNNPGFESGGSKFVMTDSLTVRYSTFSDNCGVGLWLDILNKNYALHDNTVERNYREGIAIEVSLIGKVYDNVVTGNGVPVDAYRPNGWLWDAGIGIHASPDVEVYNNTLDENYNGIVIIQQPRDVANGDWYAPPGGFIAQNVYVHDNTVTQRITQPGGEGGSSGAVTDAGGTEIFTSRNNRWVNNTYYLGTNPRPFAWMNGYRTAAAWQGYGQDVTGIFNP